MHYPRQQGTLKKAALESPVTEAYRAIREESPGEQQTKPDTFRKVETWE